MPNSPDQAFSLQSDILYLNHAAVSPWPQRTVDVIKTFADENAASGAWQYPRWATIETALRKNLQSLINAPSADDIALIKNTSEGLSFIAHGLQWIAGDNVVFPAEEFPSNRMVWESLQRYGVAPRSVSIELHPDPERALIDACDKSTKLLSVSSVQYARGLRLNLARLGEFCKKNNILYCIDGIQSIGALQTDVQAIQADFIVADGHKWMLAPEGLGVFYSHGEVRDRLTLHQYGWHMRENMHDHTQIHWQAAHSARRFEPGSPNMLGIHALHASTSILLETGLASVENRILENSQILMELIRRRQDLELLTRFEPQRYAGIVTFRHREINAEKLYKFLMANKIFCAFRGGGIRFSPHFYTPTAQLEMAVARLPATL